MHHQSIETVPIFIHKLYEILKDDNHTQIICWTNNDKEFQVHSIEKLQKAVLPKYFRHNNVNSFIRQLNMYGFHKSRKDPSKVVFSHPEFMKGHSNLLSKIKRRVKNDVKDQKIETLKSQQESTIGQISKLFQNPEQESNMLSQIQNNVNTQQKNDQEEISLEEKLPSLYQINNPSIWLIEDNKEFMFQQEQNPSTLKCLMDKSAVFDHNPDIYSPKQYRVTIDNQSKIKLNDCQSDDDGTSLAGDIFMPDRESGERFNESQINENFEQ